MVFQRVVTEELVFFNSAIQLGPCQGAPAFEEAEADALATSPRPGLLGNTRNKVHINAHADRGRTQVNNNVGKSICRHNLPFKKGQKNKM